MGLINQPGFKHKYEGIGETGAAMVVAGLSANPTFAFLTKGLQGKVLWFVAKLATMFLASIGLVVLNVGAEKVQTIIENNTFDGSWEQAQKLISDIHKSGRELTDEEVAAIDAPVKDAFRKFARYIRVRKRPTP